MISGVLAVLLAAGVQTPQVVLVLELKNKLDVANRASVDAGFLTDQVRGAVLEVAPSQRVMTKESLLVFLEANGRKLEDCEGECEVETARRAGADLVISGEILKQGDELRLGLRMHESRSARLVGTAMAAGATIRELEKDLPRAVRKVLATILPREQTLQLKSLAVLPLTEQGVGKSLTDLLSETILQEAHKLQGPRVVGTSEVKALLELEASKRKAGCDSDESCVAEIVGALGAENVLKGSVGKVGQSWVLSLVLLRARDSTVLSQGSERVEGGTGEDLLDTVGPLFERIFASVPLKQGERRGATATLKARAPDAVHGAAVDVAFDSVPAGAMVLIDNRPICESTPCTKPIYQGQYLVTMQKDGHDPVVEALIARKGAKVRLKLARLEASLSITTSPVPTTVLLDGQPIGTTPLVLDKLLAMKHEVVIDDPCWKTVDEKLELKQGEQKSLAVALQPRLAQVNVRAVDGSGAPVNGEVLIDGVKVGVVPGSYAISVCVRTLHIEAARATFDRQLSLKEGQGFGVEARLPIERCAQVRGENRFAGWVFGLGAVLGGAAMGGAYAEHRAFMNGAAGDAGVSSSRSTGKALNIAGLAALGVGVVGLGALAILPSSTASCRGEAQ